MTETSSTGVQQRRALFPRLFSRSETGGVLERILRALRQTNPRADVAVVERAYLIAKRAHEGQTRKSGEPYITHPLAVAEILVELGIGAKTIAAALLHDTVEDTTYSLDDVRRDFGDEIALLVDGVTKLDKIKFGDDAQAETVRKMVVAMSKDIRVILIKLADRLHNARTWGFVESESAERKARETLEIYAPLAHRLGIQTIKWELEDLSFAVLHPKLYVEIDSLVTERTPESDRFVQSIIDQISGDLKSARVKAQVLGRHKQHYSIYQKMVRQSREFQEIYDLTGIRILVSSIRDCYAALGAVHARWNPMPGRFKDYIATPKFNLYQSLHTTVFGPGGKAVEIQIRTFDMHKRAEYGVAAHWKYKERQALGTKSSDEILPDENMAWLAHITDWEAETEDPSEFLDTLRYEIGAKEVYVFTPKGKVVGLPSGATPVDFGYAVHTEIGHRIMGSKVNGRLVPLDTQLGSGDTVEVLTSKNPDAGPSQDWLNFVTSQRARSKIRGWFTKERRDDAIENGREALAKVVRKKNLSLNRVLSAQNLASVATALKYDNVDSLYAALGEGHVSTQSVLEKIMAFVDEVEHDDDTVFVVPTKRPTTNRENDSGVLVRGAADIFVKLAKCCTPVPGDVIVGFITRGSGVSVHRDDCPNVKGFLGEQERMIDVEWATASSTVFRVHIQVEALDRSGLLSDITRVLAEHHVNILTASVQTDAQRIATSRYVFEMSDTTHLDRVLSSVRRIDAVYDVYRVNAG
jgi:guanosine-3',5'-bis(diphosphate) 3'-pyrophosphohydrolase